MITFRKREASVERESNLGDTVIAQANDDGGLDQQSGGGGK